MSLSSLAACCVCSRSSAVSRAIFSSNGSASSSTSAAPTYRPDRKSTRLNSSHLVISYAVFCLKKKKITVKLSDSVKNHNLVTIHLIPDILLPSDVAFLTQRTYAVTAPAFQIRHDHTTDSHTYS